MPANLPPQYNKVEEEYRRASTPAERLEKSRELFRLLPKHKGTEKLQSDLKQRISRLSDEVDQQKSGKKGGPSHRVPHEGAGQLVLVGPPNSGKSALLAALTHARPEVAPYPFTTHAPQPGMMTWEDVRVQLVDLPPVTLDYFEPWVGNVVRAADAALLVADLSDDGLVEGLESTLQRFVSVHTLLDASAPFDPDDEAVRHLPTYLVSNKLDAEGALDRLEFLSEWAAQRWPLISISTANGHGLEELRARAYELLDVIRVYTKVPGKPVDKAHPYTLRTGSSIADLAGVIHQDLGQNLKFARIWGTGVFEGQTVGRDHVLHDSDVVELHV
jgi:ribosome-interacting GTPase 1